MKGYFQCITKILYMKFVKDLKYSNVRPFVALSYREQVSRTATAEGSNPTWNEQLILQLR